MRRVRISFWVGPRGEIVEAAVGGKGWVRLFCGVSLWGLLWVLGPGYPGDSAEFRTP